MFTHNNVVLLLKGYAIAHKQLHSMGFGEFSDSQGKKLLTNRLYKDEYNPLYPELWGDVLPASIPKTDSGNSSELQMQYQVSIYDQQHKDDSNQDDILSDCQQIMLDLLAFLQDPQFDQLFFVDVTGTMTPFIIDKPDEVSGWTMTIAFRQSYFKDRCAIPIDTGEGGAFAFLQTAFNLAFS